MDDVSLPIPDELIDAFAQRVADVVLSKMDADLTSRGRWLRAKEAAEYLGWPRSALYNRVQAKSIPHYKLDRMLLFKRDELDQWLEQHRIEPWSGFDLREPPTRPGPPARSSRQEKRPPSGGRPNDADNPLKNRPRKKRKRRMPPPLDGTEEQKDGWAHDLEITRAELDEMSPTDFNKAWKARNDRLEGAGVFEHVDALYKKHGEAIFSSMTPSELIQAVNELR